MTFNFRNKENWNLKNYKNLTNDSKLLLKLQIYFRKKIFKRKLSFPKIIAKNFFTQNIKNFHRLPIFNINNQFYNSIPYPYIQSRLNLPLLDYSNLNFKSKKLSFKKKFLPLFHYSPLILSYLNSFKLTRNQKYQFYFNRHKLLFIRLVLSDFWKSFKYSYSSMVRTNHS